MQKKGDPDEPPSFFTDLRNIASLPRSVYFERCSLEPTLC